MKLVRPSGQEIDVQPVDMSVRGAGFRTRTGTDLYEFEVVDVVVSSEANGWMVRTPGILRHGTSDDEGMDWGVEFINVGDLYGQWDRVLGRCFNRRQKPRVSPSLDRRILAEIHVGARRVPAAIHDLTVGGAGLVVQHGSFPEIAHDQVLAISFSLPRSKRKLSGKASVRRLHSAEPLDLIGVEFDLKDPDGFANHEQPIATYCEARAETIAKWASDWQRAA